jgi:hypothetical protein
VKKLIAFCAIVALASPAFALPTIQSTSLDNGDGTYTHSLQIESLNEVSFLEFWIEGDLNQVDGGATYDSVSGSPWAPSVVFTSDATLATALNPAGYGANAHLDTVVADGDNWPGKVSVVLDPAAGMGGDVSGTNSVHVALTSFTGGVGGPLPGGFIPLAQITSTGEVWVTGMLQSDSDQDGSFEWHFPIPEPSTAMLAAFGLMGLIAGSRRRRS